MKPTLWKLSVAYRYGAIFGALYSFAQILFGPRPTSPGEVSGAIGMVIGGAIGGVLLFGFVAWIRNWAAGAR